METIGTILRLERERRGLSVQEVFESTRITVPNVEALEQDRFESFPNKVYARAFLRDYANFLDMDSGMLLQRYESEWFAVPVVEPVSVPSVRRHAFSVWLLVIIVIVIAIIIGGCFVWLNIHSKETGQYNASNNVSKPSDSENSVKNNDFGAAQNSTNNIPQPVTKVIPKPAVSTVPVAPPATTKPDLPAVPRMSGLVLTVTAINKVWIRVVGDGKTLFQQELNTGQSKSWNAKLKFRIRCGRLLAVQVKLNGVPVKLNPDPRVHTVGIAVFGLKDIKTLPSATLTTKP